MIPKYQSIYIYVQTYLKQNKNGNLRTNAQDSKRNNDKKWPDNHFLSEVSRNQIIKIRIISNKNEILSAAYGKSFLR